MAERIAGHGPQGRRWAWATVATFGAALGATVIADRLWFRRASAPEEDTGPASGRGRPGKGPSLHSREAGYETTDANVRDLVIVMVVAITLMAGGVTTVFLMYGHFDRTFRASDKALTAIQRAPIDPPLPHLQAHPYRDIDAVLMEQNQRLTSYGWDSPDHTSAHIPIARAMGQLVGKPLDGPAQTEAVGAPGTAQPFPSDPAFNALDAQHKPADRMQGEERPGAVAPSFEPKAHTP